MHETSPDPPDIDSRRTPVPSKAHDEAPPRPALYGPGAHAPASFPAANVAKARAHDRLVSVTALSGPLDVSQSPQGEGQGPVLAPKTTQDSASNNADADDGAAASAEQPRGFVAETRRTVRMALTYSWLNVLLVFVPIGIVVATIPGVHPGVVFAMNCIAIIPLAGLLSFATESVACNMGDSVGALLNITFGNAVEVIIFIALVKNQIRIVQASVLGSILANLLLILGMGFFLGGMRYQEQIYNKTVTQMSALLLSLSVISLVLPTAFHASFNNLVRADRQALIISRGTSIVLLAVYFVYLLFQFKSHPYMYESTPQHVVDAESSPGPAAAWLDASTSDDSSSSSLDSDLSDRSIDTVRRKMKQVLRKGRRRKSSVSSSDSAEAPGLGNNSVETGKASTFGGRPSESSSSSPGPHPAPHASPNEAKEEGVEEEKSRKRSKRRHLHRHKRRRSRHGREKDVSESQPPIRERPEPGRAGRAGGEPRRVDFAVRDEVIAVEAVPEADPEPATPLSPSRRPFPMLRGVSVKSLAPSVFVQDPELHEAIAQASVGPVPRVRYGIRRTSSLPEKLVDAHQGRAPGTRFPAQLPPSSLAGGSGASGRGGAGEGGEGEYLSRAASVILLLLTTGLVATCAEFLIGSIGAVTKSSTVGQVFIGLIILPIVGNAAEHVTAIRVAMKNKMDLAIGVALGSSIQIALFVTPLTVVLGWIIGRDMTLYFTLFETVCLFVSALMVNFLVLNGRSNYLEGALLCAVYIIIAIAAFFYPSEGEASQWGQ